MELSLELVCVPKLEGFQERRSFYNNGSKGRLLKTSVANTGPTLL